MRAVGEATVRPHKIRKCQDCREDAEIVPVSPKHQRGQLQRSAAHLSMPIQRSRALLICSLTNLMQVTVLPGSYLEPYWQGTWQDPLAPCWRQRNVQSWVGMLWSRLSWRTSTPLAPPFSSARSSGRSHFLGRIWQEPRSWGS